MAWIESHQTLGRHPKTQRLALLLHVRLPEAVGLLQYLWWWALDFAPDGLVSSADKPLVARACLWHGKADVFWDALVLAGFVEKTELDEVLRIHDWADYAGRLVDMRAKNAERMRSARAKNVQRTSGARVQHVQGLPDTTGPDTTGDAAAAVARARARGDGGFQPLGTLLSGGPGRQRQRRHLQNHQDDEELPAEVLERLSRPPIGASDAHG